MKIAVTYENGQVFQHFGHTKQFKIYTLDGKNIVSSALFDITGEGHGALAGILKGQGVNSLICGGIGGGARTALAESGIEFYPGASGDADAQVRALLDGTLKYNPDTTCSHHHEGHEHGESGSGHMH